jgi:hypothetical protein
MTELYGDPNKERNARQAFKDLTMEKTQAFQEFYALFLRHVADGNISPQSLKDELNDKLTWKLQEMVATYYNDSSIDLTTFARHCTTNDQQVRARYGRKDTQQAKKTETTSRANSSANFLYKAKTTQPFRNTTATDQVTTTKLYTPEMKCFNCFKLGHMARECPEPQTERSKERTRQHFTAKLAALTDQGKDEA